MPLAGSAVLTGSCLLRTIGSDASSSLAVNIWTLIVALFAVAVALIAPQFDPNEGINGVGRAISSGSTIVLLALALVWPYPFSHDNPETYFGGPFANLPTGNHLHRTVRVGVVKTCLSDGADDCEDLPGFAPFKDKLWPYKKRVGFDNSLLEFLKTPGHVLEGKKVEQVGLLQGQRLGSLTGKDGIPQVDMVIDVFSITPYRLTQVDMAGPYYVDMALGIGNGNSLNAKTGKPKNGNTVTACAVKETTAVKLMEADKRTYEISNKGYSFQPHDEYSTRKPCLEDFIKEKRDFVYTDWSIIRSYTRGKGGPWTLVDSTGKEVKNPWGSSSKEFKLFQSEKLDNGLKKMEISLEGYDIEVQAYGIAIRNNHPNVCKKINQDLKAFVSGPDWQIAFNEQLWDPYLMHDGSDGDWHNPLNNGWQQDHYDRGGTCLEGKG